MTRKTRSHAQAIDESLDRRRVKNTFSFPIQWLSLYILRNYYTLCAGTVDTLKTETRGKGVFCLRHRDPMKMERARSVI